MKHILIIGASSRVGTAIVDRFRRGAYKIIATFHRNEHICFSTDVLAAPLDLTDRDSQDEFVSSVMPQVVRLDMAVFLPSVLPGKSLTDYEMPEVDTVMNVNFTGQAKLIKRLLPFFELGSQILMVSSISGQKGSYDPIYAASKGAVLAFVKSLATHLAPKIRVNAIAPGLIEQTAMFHGMPPELRQVHLSQIPMGQFLRPDDLAEVIYDLSQGHWAHLNGACIDLNGGRYVR